jgi:hypothetical protein
MTWGDLSVSFLPPSPLLLSNFDWEGTNTSLPSFSNFAPTQRLLIYALTVCQWAIRLASILVEVITTLPICATWSVCDRLFRVQRAIRAGGGSRFDQVKHQLGAFFAFWMIQGLFYIHFFLRVSHTLVVLWVLLIGFPAYLVCSAALTSFWNEDLCLL